MGVELIGNDNQLLSDNLNKMAPVHGAAAEEKDLKAAKKAVKESLDKQKNGYKGTDQVAVYVDNKVFPLTDAGAIAASINTTATVAHVNRSKERYRVAIGAVDIYKGDDGKDLNATLTIPVATMSTIDLVDEAWTRFTSSPKSPGDMHRVLAGNEIQPDRLKQALIRHYLLLLAATSDAADTLVLPKLDLELGAFEEKSGATARGIQLEALNQALQLHIADGGQVQNLVICMPCDKDGKDDNLQWAKSILKDVTQGTIILSPTSPISTAQTIRDAGGNVALAVQTSDDKFFKGYDDENTLTFEAYLGAVSNASLVLSDTNPHLKADKIKDRCVQVAFDFNHPVAYRKADQPKDMVEVLQKQINDGVADAKKHATEVKVTKEGHIVITYPDKESAEAAKGLAIFKDSGIDNNIIPASWSSKERKDEKVLCIRSSVNNDADKVYDFINNLFGAEGTLAFFEQVLGGHLGKTVQCLDDPKDHIAFLLDADFHTLDQVKVLLGSSNPEQLMTHLKRCMTVINGHDFNAEAQAKAPDKQGADSSDSQYSDDFKAKNFVI